MQDRRLQVMHLHLVLDDIERQLIGPPDGLPPLDTAAGKPQGEAAGMMVASRLDGIPLALAHDAAAELAGSVAAGPGRADAPFVTDPHLRWRNQ